jgi:glutamate/aspartate transport system substrate-binding protein
MRHSITAVLAATLSTIAPRADAQTLDKVRADGAITLGFREASVPFSYLDDKQTPIGYSMDICLRIADAIKTELRLPALKIVYNPVTAATQIPLIANGTVDLVCGVTTNNAERQKQVAYAPTTFVAATELLAKKSSNIRSIEDLKGKTVVSTAGSTNIKLLYELDKVRNLDMMIMTAKDQPDAFLMVETERAVAYAMDDVLIYTQVAGSKSPQDYTITSNPLSVEPYGIVLRKGDAELKRLVDAAVIALMQSGEINKIYEKWFLSPIPPKGLNIRFPMSDALKRAIAKPTDSADPRDYK